MQHAIKTSSLGVVCSKTSLKSFSYNLLHSFFLTFFFCSLSNSFISRFLFSANYHFIEFVFQQLILENWDLSWFIDLVFNLFILKDAQATFGFENLFVTFCDVCNQSLITRSGILACTFGCDLTPVALVSSSFFCHLLHFIFECLLNIFISLFIILCSCHCQF